MADAVSVANFFRRKAEEWSAKSGSPEQHIRRADIGRAGLSQEFRSDPSGSRKPKEMILDNDYDPPLIHTANAVIGRVVSKLIVKEVRNRYQSARDALDDLFQLVQEPSDDSITVDVARVPEPIITKATDSQGAGMSDKSIEELLRSAYSLNSNGDYEDAERYCDEVLRRNSRSAAAYQTRGFSRSKLRKLQPAIEDFTLAISNTPPFDSFRLGQVFYHRAYTKRLLGDEEGACVDVRQACNMIQSNPKYRYLRSRVCHDEDTTN